MLCCVPDACSNKQGAVEKHLVRGVSLTLLVSNDLISHDLISQMVLLVFFRMKPVASINLADENCEGSQHAKIGPR